MNYSEMTDFEINCAVAEALNMPPWPKLGYAGTQPEPLTAAICSGGGRLGGFDPCNSWGDAGTIIEGHAIGLGVSRPGCSRDWIAYCWKDNHCGEVRVKNSNPLRAAMTVFLIMQEKKDEQ